MGRVPGGARARRRGRRLCQAAAVRAQGRDGWGGRPQRAGGRVPDEAGQRGLGALRARWRVHVRVCARAPRGVPVHRGRARPQRDELQLPPCPRAPVARSDRRHAHGVAGRARAGHRPGRRDRRRRVRGWHAGPLARVRAQGARHGAAGRHHGAVALRHAGGEPPVALRKRRHGLPAARRGREGRPPHGVWRLGLHGGVPAQPRGVAAVRRLCGPAAGVSLRI